MTKPKSNPDTKTRRTSAATLTAKDVVRLRQMDVRGQLGRTGTSYREMARAYGISVDTLRRAIRGDSWGWIPMSPPSDYLVPGELPPAREAELNAEAQASAERIQEKLRQLGVKNE